MSTQGGWIWVYWDWIVTNGMRARGDVLVRTQQWIWIVTNSMRAKSGGLPEHQVLDEGESHWVSI